MIVSLLYHDVVAPGQFASSGFPDGDADIYKLERPEFELHLTTIERVSGVGGVALLDCAARCLSSKDLLFTFDDGGASAVSIAALLESHGWRGHFFVTTDYKGRQRFLAAEQIRELHARGQVVGSHSCSHPARMSPCPPQQIERECRASWRVLSDILGTDLRLACVPRGYYSRRVAGAAAASGIEVLFKSAPPSRVRRVNGCLVVGRYSIQRGYQPRRLPGFRSETGLRVTTIPFWNSKKITKYSAGNYCISMRKSLLRNVG